MKQTEMILEYIRTNGSITSAQAMNKLACTRLAARIKDLERKGYRFGKYTEKEKNRFGKTVTFTRYTLRGESDGDL